jgi:hypothetical protein
MHVCVQVCTVCMYCLCACMCVCMYELFVCVYVCMYVCLGLVCRLCSQRHSLLEDEPLTLSLMDELSPALPTDEVGLVYVCMYSMYLCM